MPRLATIEAILVEFHFHRLMSRMEVRSGHFIDAIDGSESQTRTAEQLDVRRDRMRQFESMLINWTMCIM